MYHIHNGNTEMDISAETVPADPNLTSGIRIQE